MRASSRLLTVLLLSWRLLCCRGFGHGYKTDPHNPNSIGNHQRHWHSNAILSLSGNEHSGHRRHQNSSVVDVLLKSRTIPPSFETITHQQVNPTLQPASSELNPTRYINLPKEPEYVKIPSVQETYGSWEQRCAPTPANTVLNFARMGLRRIGDAFIESRDTAKLYLDDNDIAEISSKAFSSLPMLELVSLSKNRIPTDNMLWFSTHYHLQTLILDENRSNVSSGSVEKIFEKLPRLEELSLKRNGISRFEVDLSSFAPALSRLDLSGNSIKDLTFLDHLPERLTQLRLDDNQIVKLKNNALKNVQVLSVSGNRIKKLCLAGCYDSYLSLENMTRLTTLNLSRNGIKEVAEDAFQDTKHLVHLDLSRNQIKTLPSGVPNLLVYLEHLHLGQNLLAIVPNICSLSRLKYLDLSENNIAAIDKNDFCGSASRIYLHTLLLAGNRITEADNDAFVHLQSLEKLDLSNNLIANLPVSLIGRANSLQVLLLRNNTIDNIDKLFTTSSDVLKELHLQENPFSALKYERMPKLVIHVKDIPQDEHESEEKDEDDAKDNDNDVNNDDQEW